MGTNCSGDRRCPQDALGQLAAEPEQRGALLFGFHPFGHDLDAEQHRYW